MTASSMSMWVSGPLCPVVPLESVWRDDFRVLWIEIDTDRSNVDLAASIGHELQHAVEVLSDSNVRSGHDMFLFYSRVGRRAPGPTAFAKPQQPLMPAT